MGHSAPDNNWNVRKYLPHVSPLFLRVAGTRPAYALIALSVLTLPLIPHTFTPNVLLLSIRNNSPSLWRADGPTGSLFDRARQCVAAAVGHLEAPLLTRIIFLHDPFRLPLLFLQI